MSNTHHFSPELSDAIGGLLESGITMLRREDAYHIGVLTHGLNSEQVEALSAQRAEARSAFQHFLDLVHSGMSAVGS